MLKILNIAFLISSLIACSEKPTRVGEDDSGLPILGEVAVDSETGEKVYYKTPNFELIDQQGSNFSSKDLEGKIQVADFFFTTCPSICPEMTTNLKVVEEAFEDDNRVELLSFSIDPEIDTPEKLREYAKNYNVSKKEWRFLTGKQDEILSIAHDYKVRAFDESSEGQSNLIHDGTFVLVDKFRRIRGYYDGLSSEEMQRLISDIRKLLNAKLK